MIPKYSNLVYGMTLGYSRSDMVFRFQGHSLGIELGLGYSKTVRFELYECLLVFSEFVPALDSESLSVLNYRTCLFACCVKLTLAFCSYSPFRRLSIS